MSRYKTEQVESLKIRYLHKGLGGEPLVFLHAFGVSPKHYEPLLDLLAVNYEVIAPVAYGINCFNPQPTSIDEYAELTSAFSKQLFKGSAHFVGHSLGGSVAMVSGSQNGDISDVVSDVVAINPLLPMDYGVSEFCFRALYKGTQEILGVDGEESSTKFGLTILLP